MNKQTIRDVNLSTQRVLVRVDFNVPIEDGEVTDTNRIEAAIPTLETILEKNPRALILMSHLGRPGGEPNPDYSLKPVAEVLDGYLDAEVHFVDDCIGEKVEEAIENLPTGGVLLLENTRFYPGEKKNDPDFAEKLAANGDIFVNDAFGSAHRAHASTEGVTHHLPAVAGLLMEKEIQYLRNAIAVPEHPFVAILGGAKVSDKIGVIDRLSKIADKVLIGGGMANTFFKAQGIEVGESLVEDEALEEAKRFLDEAGDKIVLPVDVAIADDFAEEANHRTMAIAGGVPEGWRILDVGPDTVATFEEHLADAATITWNGPLGVFEMEKFAEGTFGVARICARLAEQGATVVIGGGDSAAAIRRIGLEDQVTHVSTGGGASLDMLEGKDLPGLVALNDKEA